MQQATNSFQQFWRNCQTGIPAEVVLGSPKTPHCKNLGICQIRLEKTMPPLKCENRTIAYLRIDQPTGRLLIHFLRKSMSPYCLQYYFGEGVFRMKDDFILAPAVASALRLSGVEEGGYIEKGEYLILNDAHFLTVSLRLSVSAQCRPVILAA